MNYYELRTIMMKKISDYFEEADEQIRKGEKVPPFRAVQRKLMMQHGATEMMIKRMVETVAPGLTVEDGEVVKRRPL